MPLGLNDFKCLYVFNITPGSERYRSKAVDLGDVVVPTLGVTLDEEELIVLKYSPKHSVLEDLND